MSARRPSGGEGRLPRAAGLAVLVAVLGVLLVTLVPALLGRQSMLETQLLHQYAPWRSHTLPTGSIKGLTPQSDTLDSLVPMRSEIARRLQHGDLALWEPFGAGGSPLAAIPDSGIFSPLAWPYLVLPAWWAPAWTRLLLWAVAGLCSYAFLRRLSLGRPAAALGGLAYCTSGFLVVWVNWPQSETAAWIPALFWATERLLQRRRWSDVVPLALALGFMSVQGFPAVVGYAGLALGGYVLARLLRERLDWRARLASLLRWGVGCGLGFALAAFQLLPFAHSLATVDLSYRAKSPDDHPPFSALATTVFPFAFGSERHADFFGYNSTVELVAFVGGTAMVLAVNALAWRRRTPSPPGAVGALVGAVVVCVLLGWVGRPFLTLAMHFYLFSDNAIGRIRSVLCFALAMLAGIGYQALADRLVEPRAGGRTWVRPALVWSGAAALGVVIGAGALRAAWRVHQVREVLSQDRVQLVAVLLAVVLVVRVAGRGGLLTRAALVVVPLLVAAEGAAFVLGVFPSSPPSTPYDATGTTSYLAGHLGHDRFASPNGVLYPSANTVYGLRSTTGHTFQSADWRELVQAADQGHPQPPTLTQLDTGLPVATSPVLDLLGARYWVTDPAQVPYGRRVAPAGGGGEAALRAGGSTEVTVPAGPKRAVVVRLAEDSTGPSALRVDLLGPTGTVVATGRWSCSLPLAAGQVAVPLAAEDPAAAASTRARVTVERGAAVLGTGGGGAVLAQDDGLRLVHTGDGSVYQRLSAQPRIRWADRAVVIPDPAARLRTLGQGLPADEVVLDDPSSPTGATTTASGAAGSGGDARLQVGKDGGDAVAVTVDAPRAGWLVVADALQEGWTATLDGAPASLQPADHALVAVAVPAGRHTVRLAYDAPGLAHGAGVSALSGLVLAGLALSPRVLRARHGAARRGEGPAGRHQAGQGQQREAAASDRRDGDVQHDVTAARGPAAGSPPPAGRSNEEDQGDRRP